MVTRLFCRSSGQKTTLEKVYRAFKDEGLKDKLKDIHHDSADTVKYTKEIKDYIKDVRDDLEETTKKIDEVNKRGMARTKMLGRPPRENP